MKGFARKIREFVCEHSIIGLFTTTAFPNIMISNKNAVHLVNFYSQKILALNNVLRSGLGWLVNTDTWCALNGST